MPTWSIKIVPNPSQIAGQPANFVPDLPGSNPGTPLKAFSGDQVSWNNTTNDIHQPWPTDSSYNPLPASTVGSSGGPNYLADPIPANVSSTPTWLVKQIVTGQNTIYYYCKNHPPEHGTIVITPTPS